MLTHPQIYLDVESDDSNHSPVNVNKVHLVLTSSWRFSGGEELTEESEEQRGWGVASDFYCESGMKLE